jgi:hypothetical protein
MILIFELVCIATGHVATNSGTIQSIARAFPDQSVRVFAHESHLTELQGDAALIRQPNISFQPVPLSPHYLFRPQIVSFRRGLREFWTILSALRAVPADEPCLIMLISATPTAIFAASLLARLMRRRIRVHVGLHGNLNDAFGWRTRNPVIRAIDLRAAVTSKYGGRLRFLVLEESIRHAVARQAPGTTDTIDVLPHPISQIESEGAEPNALGIPLRIGLVGQATEAKGITPFLNLARAFQRTHADTVRFHLVGNAPAGTDMTPFAVLNEPVPAFHVPRPEFIEKLRRLHYVCLMLQPGYYELSASGALLDAITWLRPVIATRVPIIVELFERFGEIGELCDDFDDMQAVITRLADAPDPARYNRQVANLRRVRDSRTPEALAADYRRMIGAGFPGLFDPAPVAGPVVTASVVGSHGR